MRSEKSTQASGHKLQLLNNAPSSRTATATILPRPRAVLQRAQADPSSLNAAEVHVLQRTIGLRAAQRMLGIPLPLTTLVQPKLTVGPVGDKYEQEADRTAKQVMRSLEASTLAAQSTKKERSWSCVLKPRS